MDMNSGYIEQAAENMKPGDSVSFNFASGILGNIMLIYGYHKWLWVLGWGACGMALAILWPEKKQQTPS